MSKRSSGIIQLIPLFIVVFVAISVLALSLEPKPKNSVRTAVLSESESGGSHGGDSSSSSGSSGSGSSGESSSGSSSSNSSSGTSASLEVNKIETPEPKETPEVKDQAENEQELELENETEFEVHEGTSEAKIKIKLGKKDGKDIVAGSEFEAQSDFPLSVNKLTSELTVTTPSGVKVVTILPDTAVQNMLGQNVVDRILGTNGQNVHIKVDANGNVIYEISGVKDEKFLGVFNISIPKTLEVSGQTGDLTKINQDTFSRLLDAISF